MGVGHARISPWIKVGGFPGWLVSLAHGAVSGEGPWAVGAGPQEGQGRKEQAALVAPGRVWGGRAVSGGSASVWARVTGGTGLSVRGRVPAGASGRSCELHRSPSGCHEQWAEGVRVRSHRLSPGLCCREGSPCGWKVAESAQVRREGGQNQGTTPPAAGPTSALNTSPPGGRANPSPPPSSCAGTQAPSPSGGRPPGLLLCGNRTTGNAIHDWLSLEAWSPGSAAQV